MATSASNFTPNLTPSHRFANPRVNKTEVRREIALFHDQYRVLPTIDGYVSHAEFVERVIPTEPAVYLRSADVPLFIAARLRSAPLSDAALKQHREQKGEGSSAKARSKNHIEMCGPSVPFDIDHADMRVYTKRLRALGIGFEAFSSYSAGDPEKIASGKRHEYCGRIILPFDHPYPPQLHAALFDVLNDAFF